jgi:hypothetical protein
MPLENVQSSLIELQVRWVTAQPHQLHRSRTGHDDGEKSPFFPSATRLGFFMVFDLDDISSHAGSLDSTFFPSGSNGKFGRIEAAYDAWGH